MTIITEGRAHWYGPKGEQRIFEIGDEVPKGWKDHPFAEKDDEKIIDVFDHDNDGKAGGSETAPGDKDELKALRAEYKAKLGKTAFNGWDAATLREKLNG